MTALRSTRTIDRKPQILDAAAQCFAQAGFHRSTMQDVARSAGMVPGNLYRYFSSKEAIIEELVERDRAAIAQDFAALAASTHFMDAFRALGRKHFIEEPREKAILALQIWSEAALDSKIAAHIATLREEVRRGIVSVCQAAKARGEIHAAVDSDAIARLILILSDGLIRRRALDPDYDSEKEVEFVISLIGALLGGAIDPNILCPSRAAD
jgi:AcrR family transcriptional regulator